ncbi:MAG: glycerol-3-phosphate 1-O-acyltransferase PlsY [Thiotrichales bacterium]
MRDGFAMLDTFIILTGYLLGSVSAAIITSRIMGLPDPRQQGSGNPGATNVLRIGGKKAAALTLAGDLLKGVVPVLLAKALGLSLEVQLLVALAAFLGHLYPVFFGFKGGKGVATALGVLLALDWRVGLLSLGVWLAVFAWRRVSSLAALGSATLAPLLIYLVTDSVPFVIFGLVLAALLIWRHRTNIERLLTGEEQKS